MTQQAGVYAIARTIWTDPDFDDEPYSQREAWMWLIGAAAWKPTRVRGNAGPVALARGEFCFSVRFLAEKWKWSKSRVDRVICMLENRDIIRDTSRDGSKVYSINKYNDFQVVGLPNRDTNRDTLRDASGTAAGQQRDKEETVKQLNIKTEEPKPPANAGAGVVIPTIPKPVLPDWVNQDAWVGFCDMRRRKRAPMTERAKGLVLKKLDGLRQRGHDPTAVLDQSTASSWTDVYEIRPQGKNGKQSAHDKFLAAAASLIRDELDPGNSRGQGQDNSHAVETGCPLLSG